MPLPSRIGCEVSLGLMRRQKEVLMCALRPFYFDPLVDWVSSRDVKFSLSFVSKILKLREHDHDTRCYVHDLTSYTKFDSCVIQNYLAKDVTEVARYLIS